MLTFICTGRWTPPKRLLDCYNHMWIDTDVWELPENVTYELYSQPTRGPGPQGSYLVVLPPGYDDLDVNGERYPVLYWLHGGFSCSRHALWSLQFYARKMELGTMPKVILVAPQVRKDIIIFYRSVHTVHRHCQKVAGSTVTMAAAALGTSCAMISSQPLMSGTGPLDIHQRVGWRVTQQEGTWLNTHRLFLLLTVDQLWCLQPWSQVSRCFRRRLVVTCWLVQNGISQGRL